LFLLISVVFFAVAIGTPAWTTSGDDNSSVSSNNNNNNPLYGSQVGPFRSCTNLAGSTSCGTLTEGDLSSARNNCADDACKKEIDEIHVTRAFVCIALACAALALLFSMVTIFGSFLVWIPASGLAIFAAICGIIAMGVWIDASPSRSFGYSFGLEVAAWILAGIAGFMLGGVTASNKV